MSLAARQPTALVEPPPPADRLDRHAVEGRVVGVAHPAIGARESGVDNRLRADVGHAPSVAAATDSRGARMAGAGVCAGCGSRTHTPLRAVVFETTASAIPPTRLGPHTVAELALPS